MKYNYYIVRYMHSLQVNIRLQQGVSVKNRSMNQAHVCVCVQNYFCNCRKRNKNKPKQQNNQRPI